MCWLTLFTLAIATIVLSVPDVNPDLSAKSRPTRRERVRAATQAELTAAARKLLVQAGTDAVSLRAIAAELGMTAPAIYRYFGSREDLLNALVDELYDELASYLLDVRESYRDGTLSQRFLFTSRAFRVWALEHRAEFGLLFGAPIPGVGTSHSPDPAEDRGHRFGQVWLELFIELAAVASPTPRWRRPISRQLRAEINGYIDRIGQPVSVDLALLFLSCWERLYGAVCTEVFGHLHFALEDASALFEDQLDEAAERLGIPDR